ncbi:MAG TPA: alanine racemase [bacterium]|nr:alanine racemase [bacterium]HQO36968.1 alanine racemase [bacterium]HQP99318.1 alanine racemase [bacterium]
MRMSSVLTINLHRYQRNLEILGSLLSPGSRICAVVKANAYGHGLVPIAQTAVNADVAALGIVDDDEIRDLRDAGITLPILRLRPATIEEIRETAQYDVEELIGDPVALDQCSRLAQDLNRTIPVHLKVDVGIGRMGADPSEIKSLLARALNSTGIRVRGVMAHFPCADHPDSDITVRQIDAFDTTLKSLSDLPKDAVVHIGNSAALLRFPQAHYSMVRLGIASYGLRPSEAVPLPEGVLPVMRWTTRIVLIRKMKKGTTIGYGMTHRLERDSLIATLPVGYADGYFRSLSNRAHVAIRGQRCPLLGRVSMDLICVDVTDIPGVAVGEEVELLGDTISADELASLIGTINYEIVTLVGNVRKIDRMFVS